MIITRVSPFSGITNEMDIPITPEELVRLESGELIQAVVPHLSADHREFLISGITPTEWDVFLAPADDDSGIEEDDEDDE